MLFTGDTGTVVVWLSLYNTPGDDLTFYWHGRYPPTYTNWHYGFPKRDRLNQGNGEDCTLMDFHGYWRDVDCETWRSFFCETPAVDGKRS